MSGSTTGTRIYNAEFHEFHKLHNAYVYDIPYIILHQDIARIIWFQHHSSWLFKLCIAYLILLKYLSKLSEKRFDETSPIITTKILLVQIRTALVGLRRARWSVEVHKLLHSHCKIIMVNRRDIKRFVIL